jgi:Xaa-Pro dipeptidase
MSQPASSVSPAVPRLPLAAAREYLSAHGVDAWVVYDFRQNNPVFGRMFPGRRHLTRRVVLVIPARGEPVLLAAPLDAGQFAHDGVPVTLYNGRAEFEAALKAALAGHRRVAMEYSPMAALPIMGIVDAGTVELVRSMGVEVVSSADLVQACVARWSEDALRRHEEVSRETEAIMRDAFAEIGRRLRAGRATFEHEIAEHIRGQFRRHALEFPDGPIVAVNAHAADPHFEPSAERPTAIKPGDWVLIDLWARRGGEEHIFSDITWTGFVGIGGKAVPARHREVFDTVRRARDASLHAAQRAWSEGGRSIQGWELDEAARQVIIAAGFAHGIKHRTGHSLSAGAMVHGLGMNLDNLETRDTRTMLPGIGFTIEPGIYLPTELGVGLGVRNEINVYVDPRSGPRVTSCVQDEPVVIE